MPSIDKAQALVTLWHARYGEWRDKGREDAFLNKLLGCGSCDFCKEMRGDSPTDDPYRDCKICIFFSPCFKTYSTMRKKIDGKLTEEEIETIFLAELDNTDKIFEDNYGS